MPKRFPEFMGDWRDDFIFAFYIWIQRSQYVNYRKFSFAKNAADIKPAEYSPTQWMNEWLNQAVAIHEGFDAVDAFFPPVKQVVLVEADGRFITMDFVSSDDKDKPVVVNVNVSGIRWSFFGERLREGRVGFLPEPVVVARR